METATNEKEIEVILSSFLKWVLRKNIIALHNKNMPIIDMSSNSGNRKIEFRMARSINKFLDNIEIDGKYKGHRYGLGIYYENYKNIEDLKLEIKDFITQYVKTKKDNQK